MVEKGALVAVVDDDKLVRASFRRFLSANAFQCKLFSSGAEFLASLEEEAPDFVLLDLQMPGMKGLDVLAAMRDSGCAVRVATMTGFDKAGLREECLRSGATAYLVKPIETATLLATLEEAE